MKNRKATYDFYLILTTIGVLFAISLICIYAMFYFKAARIQEMSVGIKMLYMGRMNNFVSPFIIGLVFLVGLCIPKRLLSPKILVAYNSGLVIFIFAVWLVSGIKTALLATLIVSLVLQIIVLVMAVAGSQRLKFQANGYWIRIGSCPIHLGLILFILDIFFYKYQSLHLIIFWSTTASTISGMLLCFYPQVFVRVKTVGSQKQS